MKRRTISTKLILQIDAALRLNGLAQDHIKNKNARGLLVEAAKACVGQKEATGKNDGPFVVEVQKTVDGKAGGEAWCMAFVQTMIAYVEFKLNIVSPLLATEHCTTLWTWVNKNKPEQLVKFNPLAGAIAIWQHGDAPVEDLPPGHTGIELSCDEKEFNAVEGNATGYLVPVTATQSKVNREGNGVFYTHRSRIGNGDMKLLGFIKPF